MDNYNFSVAIVENHDMVAHLISSTIQSISDKIKCQVFNDSKTFYAFLETNKPEFLFLDIFLENENGLDILKNCRLSFSKEAMKIIILSSCNEAKVISDAIKFGANGFITKNDAIEEIKAVLNYVTTNSTKPYFSKNAADSLLEDKFFNEEEKKTLSPREEQLLGLICAGKTAKEIAYELELSLNTIHYYTKRLMTKMGVNRTQDLIIKALADNYIKKHS